MTRYAKEVLYSVGTDMMVDEIMCAVRERALRHAMDECLDVACSVDGEGPAADAVRRCIDRIDAIRQGIR